jgi:small conductance mechanosensitive channel
MRRVAEELRQDPAYAPMILEPLEVLGVDDFNDSGVTIKARFKTQPLQQWIVGREYRRRLKKAFDVEGIEIPFPHRTIYVGEGSKPFPIVMKEAAARS